MRRSWIIVPIIIFGVAIGGLLYLYGGQSFQRSSFYPKASLGYTEVSGGPNAGGITTRVNYRITNASDFQQLWKMVYGDNGLSVPTIDFNTYEILAVFDGSHSTDGYDVSVVNVRDTAGQRVITINHTQPGSTCNTLSMVSNPFVIVQISKSVLPLTHDETTTTTSC